MHEGVSIGNIWVRIQRVFSILVILLLFPSPISLHLLLCFRTCCWHLRTRQYVGRRRSVERRYCRYRHWCRSGHRHHHHRCSYRLLAIHEDEGETAIQESCCVHYRSVYTSRPDTSLSLLLLYCFVHIVASKSNIPRQWTPVYTLATHAMTMEWCTIYV